MMKMKKRLHLRLCVEQKRTSYREERTETEQQCASPPSVFLLLCHPPATTAALPAIPSSKYLSLSLSLYRALSRAYSLSLSFSPSRKVCTLVGGFASLSRGEVEVKEMLVKLFPSPVFSFFYQRAQIQCLLSDKALQFPRCILFQILR